MACFLIPTAEAIVTTVAVKVLEKKEKNAEKWLLGFSHLLSTALESMNSKTKGKKCSLE